MCSIGVTDALKLLLDSNKFSQRRGPDSTDLVTYNGIQFLHNLLHLTGNKTTQPFRKNDVVAIFNGEIYNYLDFGSYNTDGEILIDLYNEHGVEFIKQLDGEFAICLVDFSKDIILISTDTFACKPLWYEFNHNNFCIGSYNSQLVGLGFKHGKKLKANTSLVYNLTSKKLIKEFTNVHFDINQHKNTYDGWVNAFENSIKKRTTNIQYGVYLGLSSGYDSGAIACELLNQNVDFKSYTIIGPENSKIIQERVNLIKECEIIQLTYKEYNENLTILNNNCEDFIYHDRYMKYNIKLDKASVGLATICKRANKENRRIYLSGQGADEIISDYGFNGKKIYKHSSFGGKFPINLDGFWPWHSFYNGTQIQYLNKEEYVAGHFGIETRYPFLDKDLVQ